MYFELLIAHGTFIYDFMSYNHIEIYEITPRDVVCLVWHIGFLWNRKINRFQKYKTTFSNNRRLPYFNPFYTSEF